MGAAGTAVGGLMCHGAGSGYSILKHNFVDGYVMTNMPLLKSGKCNLFVVIWYEDILEMDVCIVVKMQYGTVLAVLLPGPVSSQCLTKETVGDGTGT